MDENDELELAIGFAAEAHFGQRDKQGAPYILHVLRVALSLPDRDAQIVGALHDVVEDTGNDLDDLRDAGFSEYLVRAVDTLTHRKDEGESYENYIERVAQSPLASRVKLADLRDNLARVSDLVPNARAHLEPRYNAALLKLASSQLRPAPLPVLEAPNDR